ncbi:hypothetical protein GCM10009800_21900 [Nocardiopsis rhodophaea]
MRADELPHHPEPPAAGDRPAGRGHVPRDDVHERRFTAAIRANEYRLHPVADTEGNVVQECAPVGENEPDSGNVDVTHEAPLCLPLLERVDRFFIGHPTPAWGNASATGHGDGA